MTFSMVIKTASFVLHMSAQAEVQQQEEQGKCFHFGFFLSQIGNSSPRQMQSGG